jgi:hypothetical protein
MPPATQLHHTPRQCPDPSCPPAPALPRFSWDASHPGIALLYATKIAPNDPGKHAIIQKMLNDWSDGQGGIKITPKVGHCCEGPGAAKVYGRNGCI